MRARRWQFLDLLLIGMIASCGAAQNSEPHLPSGGTGGGAPGVGGAAGLGGTNAAGGSAGSAQSDAGDDNGDARSPTPDLPDLPPSDGPPGVHTVGNCDGLAAPGVWQSITPPDVIGPGTFGTSAFAVDPLNAGTVYLGTDSGHGIWKTTDCGAHWVKVNTGTRGADLDQGRQWTFKIDSVDSRIMYANAGYGAITSGLYRSTNGGVDWDLLWPPADPALAAIVAYNFVGYVQIDPDNHRHILLSFHADCAAPYAPGCIAESEDAGNTWRVFGGAPPFEGQVRLYPLSSSTWIAPSNGNLYRTTDRGVTWQDVSATVAGGHSGADAVHRADNGNYYLGSPNGVIHSADGINWALIPNSGNWVKSTPGAGLSVFASGKTGFRRASANDDSNWSPMPGSPGFDDGCFAGYDVDHHILYASCGSNGFFRVVAQ
jgi:photosystem II stability/assembly factor-like uncharacterized protein